MTRPVVLIHGYSASGLDFRPLCKALAAKGIPITDLNIGNYISLNNEITIKDIAEGLDRALRFDPVLKDPATEFDAIVHSTGMLVLRSWLTNYGAPALVNTRLQRLKHLIGLAPATWGSPQASKGRTWLGALVKGNKNPGPDFMEAGDEVLDGLELGSKFTWDLAEADLLVDPPYYGTGANTPWASIFIGNTPYDGLSSVANDPGTDGTVRWSGCSLNARKITVDLTRLPNETDTPTARRFEMSKWADDRLDVPMLAVPDRNHATIVSNPHPEMVDRIVSFLEIEDAKAHTDWLDKARIWADPAKQKMLVDPGKAAGGIAADTKKFFGHFFHFADKTMEGWQQFVIRARDERGDGVSDYMVQVFHVETAADGTETVTPFEEMSTDVHAYRTDASFRCFHVRLPQGISTSQQTVRLRISASTGTDLMAYQGYGSGAGKTLDENSGPVDLNIPAIGDKGSTIFYPFTTTLVEIILNREPLPLGEATRIFTLGLFPPEENPTP